MALSKIDIENMVTGEVNVANGGTGLSSGTSGQFLKFTGSTTLASAADNAGKILQIQRTTLSSTTYTTGTTSTSIFSDSITPSASSSYILAILSTNYIMSCNDNTSNPYGNIRIKQTNASGDTKADCYLRDINSAGATNVTRQFIGSLTAYWTPNTTSSIDVHVCVEMGNNTGRIGLFGDNGHTNATTLQLFEIGA